MPNCKCFKFTGLAHLLAKLASFTNVMFYSQVAHADHPGQEYQGRQVDPQPQHNRLLQANQAHHLLRDDPKNMIFTFERL